MRYSEMRMVFKNIRDQVVQRYDAEQIKVVQYTAVSGFLFLRFFVPAITTPYLFQLSERMLEHNAIHGTQRS
jgi:RAS protein activator-like 1